MSRGSVSNLLPSKLRREAGTYEIIPNKQTQSFKILADKKLKNEIRRYLLNKGRDVKDVSLLNSSAEKSAQKHKKAKRRVERRVSVESKVNSHYLEIDHTALGILLNAKDKFKVASRSLGKNKYRPDPEIIELETEVFREVQRVNLKHLIAEHYHEHHNPNDDLDKVHRQYNLDLRVWKDKGTNLYCCEIDGSVYSAQKLEELLSLTRGEYLLKEYKDRVDLTINPFKTKKIERLSLNPLNVFGIYDQIARISNPNKRSFPYTRGGDDSIEWYRFDKYKRKYQFSPVIDHEDLLKIMPDGADDLANALTSTGLSQRAEFALQSILVFPIFIKGIYLGLAATYDELQEYLEQHEIHGEAKAAFLEKVRDLQSQLATVLRIEPPKEYEKIEESKKAAEEFIAKVAQELSDLSPEEKAKKIEAVTKITSEYEKELDSDPELKGLKDLFVAFDGFMAMSFMMSSVLIYEIRALAGLIKPDLDALAPMAQAGNTVAVIGQGLMSIYAACKIKEAYDEYLENNEELKDIRDIPVWEEIQKNIKEASQNIADDIASNEEYQKNPAICLPEISKKILEKMQLNELSKSRAQIVGNSFLLIGQTLMMAGGPVGANEPFTLGFGVGFTMLGVGVNSVSEYVNKVFHQINENPDELETHIIREFPKPQGEIKNATKFLSDYLREKTLKLEILGHLRAPELLLYKKFKEDHQNDHTITKDIVIRLFVNRFEKTFNNSPQESIDLISKADRDLINVPHHDKYNVNIFRVKSKKDKEKEGLQDSEGDVEKYFSRYQELQVEINDEGKAKYSHNEIISKIQHEFIQERYDATKESKKTSAKDLCEQLIEEGGEAAFYLKAKLLRAFVNEGQKFFPESMKRAHKIVEETKFKKDKEEISAFNINIKEIDETELEKFLEQKRKQKTIFSNRDKKSIMAKAINKDILEVKSRHLRPWKLMYKNIKSLAKLLEKMEEKEKVPMSEYLSGDNRDQLYVSSSGSGDSISPTGSDKSGDLKRRGREEEEEKSSDYGTSIDIAFESVRGGNIGGRKKSRTKTPSPSLSPLESLLLKDLEQSDKDKLNAINHEVASNAEVDKKRHKEFIEKQEKINEEINKISEKSQEFLTPDMYSGIGCDISQIKEESDNGIFSFRIDVVFDGGPAQNAGLIVGDKIIVQANDFKEAIMMIRNKGVAGQGSNAAVTSDSAVTVKRGDTKIDTKVNTAIFKKERVGQYGLYNFGATTNGKSR